MEEHPYLRLLRLYLEEFLPRDGMPAGGMKGVWAAALASFKIFRACRHLMLCMCTTDSVQTSTCLDTLDLIVTGNSAMHCQFAHVPPASYLLRDGMP